MFGNTHYPCVFICSEYNNFPPFMADHFHYACVFICSEYNNWLPIIIHDLDFFCFDDIEEIGLRNTLHTRCCQQSSNNNQTKHSEEHSLESSDLRFQ